jgi:hypothetical protein
LAQDVLVDTHRTHLVKIVATMQASLIRSLIFAAVPIFIGMVLSGCGGGGSGTTTTAGPPTTTTVTTTLPPAHCLCVFDVDRTLTGAQGAAKDCPKNTIQPGITDNAYTQQCQARGSCILTLSEAGMNLDKTFCAKCMHGIVSAGQAGGVDSKGKPSQERDIIFSKVGPENRTLSTTWEATYAPGMKVTTSLVLGWPDGQKQNAVQTMVEWFGAKGVYIPNEMVYFFDDRDINIKPFAGTGFNAQEISCATRDSKDNNAIGLCGATLAEIAPTKGVNTCASRNKVYV